MVGRAAGRARNPTAVQRSGPPYEIPFPPVFSPPCPCSLRWMRSCPSGTNTGRAAARNGAAIRRRPARLVAEKSHAEYPRSTPSTRICTCTLSFSFVEVRTAASSRRTAFARLRSPREGSATWGGRSAEERRGPTVLVRTDLDGLPGEEQTGTVRGLMLSWRAISLLLHPCPSSEVRLHPGGVILITFRSTTLFPSLVVWALRDLAVRCVRHYTHLQGSRQTMTGVKGRKLRHLREDVENRRAAGDRKGRTRPELGGTALLQAGSYADLFGAVVHVNLRATLL